MDIGTYIVGTIQEYKSEPWTNNGKSGNNNDLTLISNVFKDRFENEKYSYTQVSINDADAERIKQFAEKYQKQKILIPVVFRAKPGGRDGAWLSCFMPKGLSPVLAK